MHKLLIVDDEDKIRELIKKYADFEGYESLMASNGRQAIELCNYNSFDIIVMDVMMPELDGFSAVKEIRKNCDTPIIMLSARGEEYDKIHGFELGIDDYVVKPFSPKELMMRIGAVLSRTNGKTEDKARRIKEKDGIKVDLSARIVYIDGVVVPMSPKEYDLFVYMIENKNIALSREQLITQVWGYDFFGEDRTLDTHIKILRKTLGVYSDKIVTIRGFGYRLEW